MRHLKGTSQRTLLQIRAPDSCGRISPGYLAFLSCEDLNDCRKGQLVSRGGTGGEIHDVGAPILYSLALSLSSRAGFSFRDD